MDASERGHFERTRSRLACAAKAMGEGDYRRAKEDLSDEFGYFHETEELVESLADSMSEDAVLRHLIGDASSKGYSEPRELSGMTRIGYDMLLLREPTSARGEAKRGEGRSRRCSRRGRAANSGLMKEIKECPGTGTRSITSVRCSMAPERRRR